MSKQHPDIDSLELRLGRVLDGMTVNMDLLARDAQRAAAELRRWREAFERAKADTNGNGFSSAFRDIFGDSFK